MTTSDSSSVPSTGTRSVAELMSLGTYQGMTDDEIQRVIDFKTYHARRDEELRFKQETQIQEMNEWCEATAKAQAEANDILKKVLSVPLSLGKIDSDGNLDGGDDEVD